MTPGSGYGAFWTQLSPATSPSKRADSSGTNLGDTWTWDGVNWTQKLPTTSPGIRECGLLAYDAVAERVVMFGGDAAYQQYLDDTWEWDGQAWIRLTPATRPLRRSAHAMVYDTARRQVLLFGGWASFSFEDTWEWGL